MDPRMRHSFGVLAMGGVLLVAGYAVTVKTHPSGQSCAVTNASGTVGTSNAGCHGPVAAGGASYILMNGTPQATLWSGANCTGCSHGVTGDLNFCGQGYATCGTINDNVVSVSIP